MDTDANIADVISETVSELFDMLGKGEAGQPSGILEQVSSHFIKPSIYTEKTLTNLFGT